jgi:signal peptidase I
MEPVGVPPENEDPTVNAAAGAASDPSSVPGEPAVTDAPAAGASSDGAPVEAVQARAAHGESWWETVRSLLVILVAVFCIRTFVAEATVIPTGSMESTILIGDHVFLNKLLYGPEIPYTNWRLPVLRHIHRGDIVAFRYPRNPSVMYVKRVIAMGGDVVKVVDKRVYVNGQPLKEPYVQFESGNLLPLRDNFPPSLPEIATLPAYWGLDPNWAREMPNFIGPDGLRVPPDHFFAMGDNRDNSEDSRFWGFVPFENVVGEPLFVYWSYDAPTPDWTADSLIDRLKFDGSIVKNFLAKTRWSRTGKVF